MDTKKIFFLSVFKIPSTFWTLAKEMDISFHAFQLQDGCDPENILPPKHEPDIVLTDVSSISRIRQQITRWTKEQKPVLVFGLAGSNQHETLPQLRVRFAKQRDYTRQYRIPAYCNTCKCCFPGMFRSTIQSCSRPRQTGKPYKKSFLPCSRANERPIFFFCWPP